jgi:hypothetical protein
MRLIKSGSFAPIITNGMIMRTVELARILLESVNDGTTKVLSESAIQKKWISKAEAYRLYGRAQVDRWITEGLLKPSAGQIFISPSGIDRKKLEAVSATSNRGTYLTVAER